MTSYSFELLFVFPLSQANIQGIIPPHAHIFALLLCPERPGLSSFGNHELGREIPRGSGNFLLNFIKLDKRECLCSLAQMLLLHQFRSCNLLLIFAPDRMLSSRSCTLLCWSLRILVPEVWIPECIFNLSREAQRGCRRGFLSLLPNLPGVRFGRREIKNGFESAGVTSWKVLFYPSFYIFLATCSFSKSFISDFLNRVFPCRPRHLSSSLAMG